MDVEALAETVGEVRRCVSDPAADVADLLRHITLPAPPTAVREGARPLPLDATAIGPLRALF